jgi:hypothetical protein
MTVFHVKHAPDARPTTAPMFHVKHPRSALSPQPSARDTLHVRVAFSRPITIAWATGRDLIRRPGAWLALGGVALLLALLPRIARRALDDGTALGTELALSTIGLYAGLFAAMAGVRAAARNAALGPSPELLVTPLSRTEYVLGRMGGVCTAATLHGLVLSGIAALALTATHSLPADGRLVAVALLAGILQVALYASAGLACGATLGPALGTVVVVAFLVAARLVIPGLVDGPTIAAWWLPDPSRLDLAREAGFARPLGAPAVMAAAGAALLQTLALLLVARWAIDARARYGGA